jgi:cytochrome b
MTDIATIAVPAAPIARDTVKVWDLPLRLFHWLLVATIVLAFASAEDDTGLAQWHVAAGWVAAILIGFRLVWGFIGGQHARFANFVKPGQLWGHVTGLLGGRSEPSLGHNPLGGVATLALLFAVAIVAWTGSGLIGGSERGEALHEGVAYGLLALIGLHVAAVVIMSALSRENLVTAMISGNKARTRHPDAADATPPASLAAPVAAMAIVAATYGILQVDPNAFAAGPSAGSGAETDDD